MGTELEKSSRVSFGLFEADLQTGELWKAGRRVKLQSQPFKVLSALVERPGEVVSREELQFRLWGKDTVVDFDHSLATSVNKIREALNDSADNPRFIETLARRGYRFIAPVTFATPVVALPRQAPQFQIPAESSGETVPVVLTPAQPTDMPGVLMASEAAVSRMPPVRSREAKSYLLLLAVLGMVLGGGVVGYLVGNGRIPREPARISQVTDSGRLSPGVPYMESLPASATDGLRIFASIIDDGRPALAEISASSGQFQLLQLPSEIASPSLGDISPDGSKLLVRSHLSPESEQPLWVIPTGGGSALRVANILAHDATWMPDGKGIVYAAGNELAVTHLEDGTQTPVATLPFGRAFWLRWSPDGKVLRFTIIDPIAHTSSLWELPKGSKTPRRLLGGWDQPADECCGVWSGDGKDYIFQAALGGSSDLWRMSGHGTSGLRRITSGPLTYQAPFMSRAGRKVYFLGFDSRSELERYDAEHKAFLPQRDFLLMADRVTYSRDKQWVAWTDAQGRFWRARADGTEKIQVTPDAMQVFMGQWSPNGQQFALMAREPGKAWQIYTVSAAGGSAQRLLKENRNSADPSWSADGKQIVFGRLTDLMGKESATRDVEVLDLATHRVTPIPESEGLFSPRWSPDGRWIAAISLDQRRLLLYDTVTQVWKTLAQQSVADPVWSADSRFIYMHAAMADKQPIYRVNIASGQADRVADLSDFPSGDTADYFFVGLRPDNAPLVRARTSTGNIYSLDLDQP